MSHKPKNDEDEGKSQADEGLDQSSYLRAIVKEEKSQGKSHNESCPEPNCERF